MNARTIAALLGLGGLLTGCAPDYEYLEMEAISFPPAGISTTIDHDVVEIPVGIAIAVRAVPRSSNATPYESGDRLDLRAKNRERLEIEDTPDRFEFVFIGQSEGSTCIEVEINGNVKECIDTTVTPSNL